MHPDPEDIGFFCAVVIGPGKRKGSQAKGSARNRHGRIPTILQASSCDSAHKSHMAASFRESLNHKKIDLLS